MTIQKRPMVSVIVPCRNEARYIRVFLDNVIQQQVLDFNVEVIIADGMSDDGTREILTGYCRERPQIRMIDNTGRIVSTGLNAAIGASIGEIIVRMDVHTQYAIDYIAQCVSALCNSGADNVGGPWVAIGRDYVSSAVAIAFASPFMSGGARGHSITYEGPVDTVYLGCWNRAAFDRYGLFDESLVRNQDDELNLRIIRNGGQVWQSPKIRSWYTPRSDLSRVFRQYAQYGYWKVRVIEKHRLPASLRHLVPGGFVAAMGVLMLLALFWPPARLLLGILLAAYMVPNLVASAVATVQASRWNLFPILPAVFFTYHVGYGYGFLRGIIDFAFLRMRNGASFTDLTRGG